MERLIIGGSLHLERVSRTPKLDNLGVCQKIWESAIFLKYNIYIFLSETQTIIITLE